MYDCLDNGLNSGLVAFLIIEACCWYNQMWTNVSEVSRRGFGGGSDELLCLSSLISHHLTLSKAILDTADSQKRIPILGKGARLQIIQASDVPDFGT